jgi:hypothetical protein
MHPSVDSTATLISLCITTLEGTELEGGWWRGLGEEEKEEEEELHSKGKGKGIIG